MTKASYKRKCSVGHMVSEGQSSCWQREGMMAGTAESTHLKQQVGDGEGTLGMMLAF